MAEFVNEVQEGFLLVEVLLDVLDEVLERGFFDVGVFLGHATYSLWQQIVNNIRVLLMQLEQEQLNQIPNPQLLILQQQSNIAYLTLQLQHPIQNQVSDHHERCLPHIHIFIPQT